MIKVEARLGLDPDVTRRLGALAVRVVEDAGRLRERLRLTNEEHRRLRAMSERWWQLEPGMGQARRAVLYRIGPGNFLDRALIAFSRSEDKVDDQRWLELVRLPEMWTPPNFPLAAKDFIERGVEKGPLLGAALAAAEDAWITAGFPMDVTALSAIANAAAERSRVATGRGSG
jgi:hypothetical protein